MTAIQRQIEVRLARTEGEKSAVGRLRYQVFVEELGGDGDAVDHANRLERDGFDPFVDHLIAVDTARPGEVIGVYRLLRADMADKAGRFYSETEYDLSALRATGRNMLELGRSCVRADYRTGTAMYHLWQGLSNYIERYEIEILFGVASFHGTDISAIAHPLSNLAANHLAPETLRATSKTYENMRVIAPHDIDRPRAMRETPALIKAYLRLGGMVGDGAYIDHEFNTVDVCLVMDTANLSKKYRDMYSKERRR